MWFIKNPEFYDVIVVENMFGDIITDEAAIIQGGLGIAAGGNLNPKGVSMFEPMGGSTPKYAGKNVINPLAAIEAGRMMLKHIGEKEASKSIGDAVEYFLKSGRFEVELSSDYVAILDYLREQNIDPKIEKGLVEFLKKRQGAELSAAAVERFGGTIKVGDTIADLVAKL
jgi:isocitrate dehydrogenase